MYVGTVIVLKNYTQQDLSILREWVDFQRSVYLIGTQG